MGCVVRAAGAHDAAALVALCAEHAAYERADYDVDGKEVALRAALANATPRMRVWVAERDGAIVGYASASAEWSTWRVREYLHLDCIYVQATERNGGVGRALFAAVVEFARANGHDEIQWQTPSWNVDAQRWYRRLGGVGTDKVRYRFPVAE